MIENPSENLSDSAEPVLPDEPSFDESESLVEQWSLEGWYTSPEKQLVDTAMSERLDQLPDFPEKGILLDRVAIGKRIRPYMLFLMNKGDIDPDLLVDLGVAMELSHQASLIFDDTIDAHSMREGDRPSLHSVFGDGVEGAGVADHLAEYLLTLYEDSINETNLSAEHKNAIRMRGTEIKQEMIVAQLADRFVIPKPDDSTWADWYMSNTTNKTSSLMAFPFDVTGILQEKSDSERAQLRRCGEAMGRIYQLYDDIQDLHSGVEAGPLALSYPLAVLLDGTNELSIVDNAFLHNIVSKRCISDEDAQHLQLLLETHKTSILEATKVRVDEASKYAQLPDGIEGSVEMEELFGLINNEDYWNYKVPNR